jgi:hypothetical protein
VRVPEGETESQVIPPLVPEALTEIRTAVESVTESVLWMILVLPAVAAKDSEVGESVRELLPSWPRASGVENELTARTANANNARKRST